MACETTVPGSVAASVSVVSIETVTASRSLLDDANIVYRIESTQLRLQPLASCYEAVEAPVCERRPAVYMCGSCAQA